jgi:hypothetical protein
LIAGMDLRSKSIAPFEELSSEFEGAVVFVDDGAAEAVRWCGGVEFLLERMGVANLHNLRTPVPAGLLGSLVHTAAHKAIFLLSTLLWECENELLSAIRRGGFDEVLVCCSVSESAHALYATKDDSEHVGSPRDGTPLRFNTFAANLQAQVPSAEKLQLSVRFFPLLYSTILDSAKSSATPDKPHPLGLFVLNNTDCVECTPLSLCQVASENEPSGAQPPGSSPRPKYEHVSEVGAGDVPPALRLRYKLLANMLAEMIAQWGLAVEGGTFALGGSSKLLGYSVLQMLQQRQEALIIERGMDADQVLELLQSKQPASLVLLDRSVDLFTPAAHSDSLADRVLAALPRANQRPAQHGQPHGQQQGQQPPPAPSLCHEVASSSAFSGAAGHGLGFGGAPPILPWSLDSPTASFPWTGGMAVAHIHTEASSADGSGPTLEVGGDEYALGELLARSTDKKALRTLHTALAKIVKAEQCPKLPGWGQRGRDAVFQLLRSLGANRLGECSRHHEILQVC